MRLVHKNVPVNQTIQISGHKIDNSINSYIHIIGWQAKQISHILWTFHQPGDVYSSTSMTSPTRSSRQQLYGACGGFTKSFCVNNHFLRDFGLNFHNTESKSMELSQMFNLRQADETSALVKSHLARPFKRIRVVLTVEVTVITAKVSSVDTHCVPNSISIFVYTSWHVHPQHGVATCSIELKIATLSFVQVFRYKSVFYL